MTTINIGDTVRISATVYDAGEETDPTTLQITVTDPDSVATVYVYGVDPEVVKENIGEYHIDVLATKGGQWSWLWESTGDVTANDSGTFDVEFSAVSLTITAQDSVPNPVPDAQLTVVNSDGVVVASGRTNASGQLVALLKPGVYVIAGRKDGWRFTDEPITVTVAGTATITGEDLGIVTSVTLAKCRLYGYVTGMDGGAVYDAVVIVEPIGQDIVSFVDQGGSGLIQRNVGVLSEKRELHPRTNDGYWEIDLLQGTMVRVYIPKLNFERKFRVPAENVLNVRDARPDPGHATVGITSDTPATQSQ